MTEELQLNEVVAFLLDAKSKSCAVIHPASKREAGIYGNGNTWTVCAIQSDPPSEGDLRTSRSLHFFHSTQELRPRFGPDRGKLIILHQLTGTFEDVVAAASAALALVRSLAKASSTEWLWVTSEQYDEREDPPVCPGSADA